MIVGFSGTRKRLTNEQKIKLARTICQLKPTRALHGGCLGADLIFHRMCRFLKVPIEVYLGDSECMQCDVRGAAKVWPKRRNLERNRIIANRSDHVIIVPNGYNELWRGSGTWATKRYAVQAGKRVTIVYPDGSTEGI